MGVSRQDSDTQVASRQRSAKSLGIVSLSLPIIAFIAMMIMLVVAEDLSHCESYNLARTGVGIMLTSSLAGVVVAAVGLRSKASRVLPIMGLIMSASGVAVAIFFVVMRPWETGCP